VAPIENISDTARWVAVYRARETARPDAHFRDPYAGPLAGERGEEIVRSMPGGEMSWPIVVRTVSLDEMIAERVRLGADTVLNLAAGLDARPYRMELPESLRWIEVDLPGIIEYKTAALAEAVPRCRLERVALDLVDPLARRELFARISAESQRTLVVTEGLLLYLDAAAVADLAADLHAQSGFAWWLCDLASPKLLEMLAKTWGPALEAGNAPFKFGPADAAAFFEPYGWRPEEVRSTLEEGARLRREPRFAWLGRLFLAIAPPARREEYRKLSQYVVFARA
jgi:methyltransferase (TIGR00027 family)